MIRSDIHPFISIVVPIYNVQEYVGKCLDSIMSQTFEDFEVILVDDCGTDDSMNIAGVFAEKNGHDKIRIVCHDKNRGLSGARNTGIDEACGEYVLFVDSDDYLSPDCLEFLSSRLAQYKYDVVIGGYLYDPPVVDPNDINIYCEQDSFLGNPDVLSGYADGYWYMMAWNKLCRLDFIRNNNLYFEEGLLHEDMLWSFKVFSKASSVALVKHPTYFYRIRNNSIITGMARERDMEIHSEVFEKMKDFILSEPHLCRRMQYSILEGKKTRILYELLRDNESYLYRKTYALFRGSIVMSPLKALREKLIGPGVFIRDFHYLLPPALGRYYKKLFYLLYYKLRGKTIR